MEWIWFDTRYLVDQVSILDGMLDQFDPRSAKEQLNEGYAQYGGFIPFPGITLDSHYRLCYPGDPPQNAICFTILHDELIILYPGDWVAVMQLDSPESAEVCRMD